MSANFVTEESHQDLVWVRIVGVILESGPLKPLCKDVVPTCIGLRDGFGKWQSEERETLAFAVPTVTEFEAMCGPILPEGLVGDGMACLSKVVWIGGVGFSEGLPIATLLP